MCMESDETADGEPATPVRSLALDDDVYVLYDPDNQDAWLQSRTSVVPPR